MPRDERRPSPRSASRCAISAATAAWLDQQDIAYRRDSGGTIGVPPEHTHGVMLEFVAAGPRLADA